MQSDSYTVLHKESFPMIYHSFQCHGAHLQRNQPQAKPEHSEVKQKTHYCPGHFTGLWIVLGYLRMQSRFKIYRIS
uniref:Uncharacterized protein n=1 Tax=Anguilla anguilla TaxID=7936 RepID=A0A0E9T6S1_ANGAN